jgi:hypothetical protein
MSRYSLIDSSDCITAMPFGVISLVIFLQILRFTFCYSFISVCAPSNTDTGTSACTTSYAQEEPPFLKAEALNFLQGVCNTYIKFFSSYDISIIKKIYIMQNSEKV